MRTFYKSLILVFLVSCGSSLEYNEAIEKNNERYDDIEARQDAKYLVQAKSASLLLQKLGVLGVERAYASDLNQFAKKMNENHTRLNEQLNELGKDEKIKLPQKMSLEHKGILQRVQNISRERFDDDFIRQVERSYEDTIELFKDISINAHDDEIRAFSAKALGILRDNEDRADEIEDELI